MRLCAGRPVRQHLEHRCRSGKPTGGWIFNLAPTLLQKKLSPTHPILPGKRQIALATRCQDLSRLFKCIGAC